MKKLFLLLLAASTLSSFKGDDAKDKVTLYVDAGHGGEDAGAVSKSGDKESDLCLQLAKMVARKGSERNVNVVLIRTDDEYIKLMDRVAKTNEATGNSYFVSIHLETSPAKNESGIKIIMDKSSQIDGTVGFYRKMMHNFSKLGPVKTESKSAVVLHNNRVPAVVLSPGYIDNDADVAKVKTKAYQEAIADVLINAVTM